MLDNDVEKMTFRMHEGLFKFLSMPFGLTNVLVTFQALMNDVLRPYLRQFMLVFFVDILIYIRTWSEHLRHVNLSLHQAAGTLPLRQEVKVFVRRTHGGLPQACDLGGRCRDGRAESSGN
jgi:hypothetical protein